MKKIISLILIAVMCLSCTGVAAARDVSYEEKLAEDLKTLGIFKGVSDTNFDLGRAPTRVEALVMLIRLLGKDKTALSGDWSHPFSDVPQWADGYVGYAYENGLTNGVSKTEFGTGDANAQMFLTFVLRSLDYSDKDGADFTYAEPYSLAKQTGILLDSVNRKNFWRADVVVVSYAALSAYMKNTDTTLAEKLMGENVFTKQAFSEYYDQGAIKNYQSAPEQALSAEEIFAKCSPAVFYIEVYDAREQKFATGSGFFINSDGTAVTNYHVIDGAHSAKIKIGESSQMYDVEYVYDFSEAEDWAVIQIDGTGFDYLEVGDAASVVGGATVYAIGSPLGLHNTISQGIISNVSRELDGVSFIQTSAPISSGSSGGALINKYGEVIGITSAKFLEGENLGLALPITVTDKCDYSNHYSLSQVAGGFAGLDIDESLTGRESIIDFVQKFVANNYNETFTDGSLGYSTRDFTPNGIYETILTANPKDGAVSLIIYEEYNGSSYFADLYFSDPAEAMGCYYTYDSWRGGVYDMEAVAYVDATKYKDGDYIKFHDYDGRSISDEALDAHQEIISEYIGDAVYYLKYVIIEVMKSYGYNVDIKDLGFACYE